MITFRLEKNNFTNTHTGTWRHVWNACENNNTVTTCFYLACFTALRLAEEYMMWNLGIFNVLVLFFRMSVVVYSCLVIMEQYLSCTCRGLLLAFWLSSCLKTRRAEAWSVSLACFQQIVTFSFDSSQKRWYTSLTSDQYFSLCCTYISFSLIFFTFSTLSLSTCSLSVKSGGHIKKNKIKKKPFELLHVA